MKVNEQQWILCPSGTGQLIAVCFWFNQITVSLLHLYSLPLMQSASREERDVLDTLSPGEFREGPDLYYPCEVEA